MPKPDFNLLVLAFCLIGGALLVSIIVLGSGLSLPEFLILVISGAVLTMLGTAGAFFYRAFEPKPQLEIEKYECSVPTGTKPYHDVKGWKFWWEIKNSGDVPARGVEVGLVIRAEVDSSIVKPYPFTMFKNLTIMPEKVRNDAPPEIVMFQDLGAKHFELRQTIHHRSDNSLKVESEEVPERFPTEDETGHPLGYRFDLIFAGSNSNLTVEDMRTWRYRVSFFGGKPRFVDSPETEK